MDENDDKICSKAKDGHRV